MLTYALDRSLKSPLYAQLCEAIRKDITCGALRAGERLPSRRALAAHLGISLATVDAAYGQLEAEGYLSAKARSGFTVCAIGAAPAITGTEPTFLAPPAPEMQLSLCGGGEDSAFPLSVWAKTVREVMSQQGAQLLRPVPPQGVTELRRAIAAHLQRARGLRVSPEQIVIGAGNEYLYGLIVQLLGRQARYAVEDPCHRGIAQVYRAQGATLCPLPLDENGLRADLLEESGAGVVHLSPAHHFPTGIVMPIRRRNEILRWAGAQAGRCIVEDDYDSELRHTGQPLAPLFSRAGGAQVIYVSTFSQTLAPSLRVAFLCLPPQLLERFRETLGFYACTVPALEQYALARFIDSGGYERHLNRLRKRCRDRREAILSQLASGPLRGRCTVREQDAGTHFLLHLHTDRSDAALRESAARLGLRLRFLSDYALCAPAERGTVVFQYANLSAQEAQEALLRLANLLDEENSEIFKKALDK